MEKNNMSIWDATRKVPSEAKKSIAGGRLKGMTDINPVWRMKVLTELLGVCGVGWKYEITRQWAETYGAETKCFCNINLYIKQDGVWSDAIPGTGGSSLVTIEKGGAVYVSDEGYKMALTDAISVAMKSLGVAADIYFEKGADYGTKYEPRTAPATAKAAPAPKPQPMSEYEKDMSDLQTFVNGCNTLEELQILKQHNPQYKDDQRFRDMLNNRFSEISQAK